ncbi:hypothetical protein O181_078723 [Austropuccinia psidii MF-1]|uniref:Uncharacterized protein n=1 Tax=Austropuccinia psidii MF-1 TaxID=1389203 RepID=A0A9Q3FJH9_9BASI|nr:hypothetical protein [Austropuccinia psidii MF-1]
METPELQQGYLPKLQKSSGGTYCNSKPQGGILTPPLDHKWGTLQKLWTSSRGTDRNSGPQAGLLKKTPDLKEGTHCSSRPPKGVFTAG